MLGGITLFALALFGYMGAPPWVVLPFALAGAALKPLAARGPAPAWRWQAALRALPLTLSLTALAFALGWGLRLWLG